MTDAVLDASALLTFLLNEPGADTVRTVLSTASISAVTLAETYVALAQYGKRPEDSAALIGRLRLRVVPFDADQARVASSMRVPTRAVRLSLGSRACLALALALGAPAMTAERVWGECDVGARLIHIR